MCKLQSRKRMYWDILVMLLATWNCFQIPFSVAFAEDYFSHWTLELFNSSIDFIFIMDVVVTFRSSYQNSRTGDEVFDCKLIAINYIKGRFLIDILASLPLDFISWIFLAEMDSTWMFQLFGLLKLIRILRLSRLIAFLNLKQDLKMQLKLGKLMFFLILYIHFQGCIWYFIVSQNKTWIPPLDYLWIETELWEKNIWFKYWTSQYHSILILSGGDVGPRGPFQLFFVTYTILIAAIVNANIFGNLALIVQQMNHKNTVFQDKIDSANTAMKNMRLPELTQKQVQEYIFQTEYTLDN